MKRAAPIEVEQDADALLAARDLVKEFPVRSGLFQRQTGSVQAVSGISFDLFRGETLGLVGESGCGKSTTARLLLRLLEPTSGEIHFEGRDVLAMGSAELRAFRRRMQIVFQDPYASLNPRMTVMANVAEPLRVHKLHRKDEVDYVQGLLEKVGLKAEHVNRYPHEFSGGQRQRIGIARALTLEPDVLVLDEPVSALDVSIQAGVVNLLDDLQDELSLAYLFVAHDLSVVRHICDRVAVMYLGKVVEIGPSAEVYKDPAHPYTQALLSAVPVPDPRKERARTRIMLEGDVPSPADPPSGCRFRTRCWHLNELEARGVDVSVCRTDEPPLEIRATGHPVACHFAETRDVVSVPVEVSL